MLQPAAHHLDRAADVFRILAHPSRLKVLCHLSDGRVATQRALLDELGWPQSTLQRHVAALRATGLLLATRRGNEVRLAVRDDLPLQLVGAVCAWIRAANDAPHVEPVPADEGYVA